MNIKSSRIMTAIGLAVLAGAVSVPQKAASQTAAAETSSTSANWDVFRAAGDDIEKGDVFFEAGKYQEALNAYNKALAAFQKLRTSDPNWNRSVVSYRITMAQGKVSSAERKLNEVKSEASGKTVPSTGAKPSNEVIMSLTGL